MLRRVLIASAALAMVLVTSFPDYAFARGGMRAGGRGGGSRRPGRPNAPPACRRCAAPGASGERAGSGRPERGPSSLGHGGGLGNYVCGGGYRPY